MKLNVFTMLKNVFKYLIMIALYSCETTEINKIESHNLIDKEEFLKSKIDLGIEVDQLDIIGTYQGVIPTATCCGMMITITLHIDKTFIEESLWIDQEGEIPDIVSGNYIIEGDKLILSIENEPLKFYEIRDGYIQMLDAEGNKIESTLNYKLVKQELLKNKVDPNEKSKLDAFENKRIILGKSVGLITPNTSEKDLIKLYGKENIKNAVVYSYEGIDIMGTEIIFPNSENNVTIQWHDENRLHPEYIRLKGEWKTTQGIGVGSTIQKVEKVNGKPFEIYGWEIDTYLSGTVYYWDEGKFQGKNTQFINFQFNITKDLSEKEYREIIGGKIKSDFFLLQKAALKVENMEVYFEN